MHILEQLKKYFIILKHIHGKHFLFTCFGWGTNGLEIKYVSQT